MKSMAASGFLLTPEITSWAENLQSGELSDPTGLMQKSISFTELEPAELSRHATRYGPYSLEFPIPALLELGALPVVYLPPSRSPRVGLDGIGAMHVMRLGEIQHLLELLRDVSDLEDDGTRLLTTRNGQPIAETSISVTDAQEFVRLLELQIQPVEALVGALKAFLGLVYPTTNEAEGDDELKHYREREWRIVGSVILDGVEIHRELSDDQRDAILEIDPFFFGESVKYPWGSARPVDQCLAFTDLGGRHVLSYASRCIVPLDAIADIERVLDKAGLDIDVIGLEDL